LLAERAHQKGAQKVDGRLVAPALDKPHGPVVAWLRKLGPSLDFVRTDLRTLRLAIALGKGRVLARPWLVG